LGKIHKVVLVALDMSEGTCDRQCLEVLADIVDEVKIGLLARWLPIGCDIVNGSSVIQPNLNGALCEVMNLAKELDSGQDTFNTG
jgi:hypothetical protein